MNGEKKDSLWKSGNAEKLGPNNRCIRQRLNAGNIYNLKDLSCITEKRARELLGKSINDIDIDKAIKSLNLMLKDRRLEFREPSVLEKDNDRSLIP